MGVAAGSVPQGSTDWANEEWVVEIRNELDQLLHDGSYRGLERYSKKGSIYKVPALPKNLNNKAYEPQMVSFGPYHYGKEQLMTMEKHKHDMLLHFLNVSGKPLESYVNALAPVLQDLKDCYDALPPCWHADTSKFLKLMVLDGCFMLHMLRVYAGVSSGFASSAMETEVIKLDMLLL
ncbi:hypothetical protein RHGRI_022863 [Rhododendron griersonianum]|uniref:Uncharacterized protein n=1 Tax=Rhododendron griersonianum TaxID=479676 RepID=A0AAV6J5R3_9ERIC|nr:hypothetical protein RHGRI_022863 [Rhododendron griersonianum]